jgi:hypothetical protein
MSKERLIMSNIKLVYQCIVMAAMTAAVAWGVVPVTVLGEKADSIIAGELLSMTAAEMGAVVVRVQPTLVLKGQAPLSSITALLPASPIMKQHAGRKIVGKAGAHGLWFLKQASGGNYEILPTVQGDYIEMESFVPIPAWWVPPAEATLSEQLLDAMLVFYQSVEDPASTMDVGKLLASLDAADCNEALAVANKLMNSPSSYQRVLGFAAAIRRSSDEALTRLAREMDTLRLDKDFLFWIPWSLENYYQPSGSSSIAALSQLIGLHSDTPRSLDAAVGRALQKVGTKEILPAMVLLLDSPDSSAKRNACWYFHYYTTMAGPDGKINRTGNGRHPFHTEESHTGRDLDTVNIDTAFWKSWWAENREKLGFTTITSSQ